MSRTITLSDEAAALLDDLVARGRYPDADTAMVEGLRLADAADDDAWVASPEVAAAIEVGLRDLEEGRYMEFESTGAMADYLRTLGEDIIQGSEGPSEG